MNGILDLGNQNSFACLIDGGRELMETDDIFEQQEKHYTKKLLRRNITVVIETILIISLMIFGIKTYISMSDELKYNESIIQQQYNTNKEITRDMVDIKKKIEFYEDYAVVVASDDSVYHTYGCSHLPDGSFRIYNITAAKSNGYTACSYCN